MKTGDQVDYYRTDFSYPSVIIGMKNRFNNIDRKIPMIVEFLIMTDTGEVFFDLIHPSEFGKKIKKRNHFFEKKYIFSSIFEEMNDSELEKASETIKNASKLMN